ncbi:nuclear transport factor 2 family protein (plasmid) [Streptomyces sp. NBC_01450]|uniref:nuclear transport factor 2 family protein n=1 Tax=Streptomyces sp. NBC_01450 TaxID=2903871 RepID=UPI002E2EFC45|nr:nuclear transport factor 2 family protein [Streptomyces sp. NBC_01450]
MHPTHDDIIEIEQVLSLWGHVLDDRAWKRLGECLTENAIYDASVFGFEPVQGIDVIEAMLRNGEHAVAHHVTNILVIPDGTEVTHVKSKGLGILRDGTVSSATYHDDMVRTASGWRVAKRTLARLG